ncbi:unnamed protein product [Amoebophrya sp. A120]|nr:unnamed protein product [Amoebophrya sp. A120]|eukprot:GSA120T00016245001.1
MSNSAQEEENDAADDVDDATRFNGRVMSPLEANAERELCAARPPTDVHQNGQSPTHDHLLPPALLKRPANLLIRYFAKKHYNYGYVVLFLAFLGCTFTAPGQASTIGTTTKKISEELQIDIQQISELWFIATVFSALTLPAFGKLLDLLGVTVMFPVCVFLVGFSAFWYSAVGAGNTAYFVYDTTTSVTASSVAAKNSGGVVGPSAIENFDDFSPDIASTSTRTSAVELPDEKTIFGSANLMLMNLRSLLSSDRALSTLSRSTSLLPPASQAEAQDQSTKGAQLRGQKASATSTMPSATSTSATAQAGTSARTASINAHVGKNTVPFQTKLELCVGLYLLRTTGNGCLWVASVYAVNQWFIEKRAEMQGRLLLGTGASLLFFASAVEARIEWYGKTDEESDGSSTKGWRKAFFELGLLELFFLLPIAVLFMADRPENYGLAVDTGLPLPAEKIDNFAGLSSSCSRMKSPNRHGHAGSRPASSSTSLASRAKTVGRKRDVAAYSAIELENLVDDDEEDHGVVDDKTSHKKKDRSLEKDDAEDAELVESAQHLKEDVTKPVEGPLPAEEQNFTLSEAVRTVHFWLFSLTMAVTGGLNAALLIHLESILLGGGDGREGTRSTTDHGEARTPTETALSPSSTISRHQIKTIHPADLSYFYVSMGICGSLGSLVAAKMYGCFITPPDRINNSNSTTCTSKSKANNYDQRNYPSQLIAMMANNFEILCFWGTAVFLSIERDELQQRAVPASPILAKTETDVEVNKNSRQNFLLSSFATTPSFQRGFISLLGGLQGLATGFNNTLQTTAHARAFGRLHNGAIQGLAKAIMVIGSAVGPELLILLSSSGNTTGDGKIKTTLPDFTKSLVYLTAFPLVLNVLSVLSLLFSRNKESTSTSTSIAGTNSSDESFTRTLQERHEKTRKATFQE